MNKIKICFFILFFVYKCVFASKSVAIATNYYNNNFSLEVINDTDKMKLTLVDKKNVIINTLYVKNELLQIKKGKAINAKKLKSGFSSNVYATFNFNGFQLYTLLPSLGDNLYGISGFNYTKSNLSFDFSIFESKEKNNLITKKSYYINYSTLKDMKKGFLYIFSVKTDFLDIRSEIVSSSRGFYFSNTMSFIYKNLSLSFENQNLNYKYNFILNINFGEAKLKVDDKIYKESPFSGKGSARDYILSSSINKSINQNLALGYKIKSIKITYDECIKFDENLDRSASSDIYFIISLIRKPSDLINIKCGYTSNKLLLELKINSLKLGYKNKELYSIFEFKNRQNNLLFTFKYQLKKHLDIGFKYYF